MRALRLLAAFAAALACGCIDGTIDAGDPVDHALACASPRTLAAAPAPPPTPGEFVPGPSEDPRVIRTGYVPVTRDPSAVFAPGMRTVYLNRDGATVTAGYDDAARNVSSVLLGRGRQKATVPAAAYSDADWLKLVSCVRDEFARFNLQIVPDRPAEPGFMMALIGGGPGAIGLPAAVGGVAPLDSNACNVIEGAIVYVFPDTFRGNLTHVCEAAAQEIAHAFSLDHELLASDPMTYLNYSGHKVFQDQDAQCGESARRACVCRRPSQNSVQVLGEKAGWFQDPDGPAVAIASPDDGAMLGAGTLPVTVRASHSSGIKKVTLHYQDASSFIVADCTGRSIACARSGDDHTFRVERARGIATLWAEATSVDGKTNRTHARTVSAGGSEPTTPGDIRIAVSVDLASFAADRKVGVRATITTGSGSISAADVLWTDRRGVTSTSRMCPADQDDWARSIQVAPRGGERAFVVQAGDTAGRRAASSRYTIIADF